MSLDTWDVVIISASNGWGIEEQIKPLLEEELQKEIIIHDYAIGSLSALKVLEGFEGNSLNLQLDQLNELIPEADMIIIFVDPAGIENFNPATWDKCFGLSPVTSTTDCGKESLGDYPKILAQIYDHIFELKGNSPVIIRAMGLYNPIISEWEKVDSVEACNQCWASFNDTIRDVSAEYNIPYADVWLTFNGADHLEDPREKGYILPDGEHCTELGAKAQAEAILALGYEPVKR